MARDISTPRRASSSASECSRKRSLSWAVMVGCAGSRTGPRAYAALMLRSRSALVGRHSSNAHSVRDRGVGGSNPLARPIPREISEIQSVRSLGSVAEFALRNRVGGASNHVSITNRLKFIDKTPEPIHLRLCRGQAVTLQVTRRGGRDDHQPDDPPIDRHVATMK